MNLEQVKALSNEELRIKAAELAGLKITYLVHDMNKVPAHIVHNLICESGEQSIEGSFEYEPLPDYPNDIVAAMELALSISDRYWMELHTPFRVGDPFFAGFTPLGTSGWNGRPDNQCEGGKPGEAIARAYVMTMTQEAE